MDVVDFRLPLSLCSAFAVAGNLLFAISMKKSSFVMALAGRLLIGFSSAEFLNRQLLSTIQMHENINAEVAQLAMMTMMTISISTGLGSVMGLEMEARPTSPSSTSFGIGTPLSPPYRLAPPFLPFVHRTRFSLEGVGYVMAIAWLVHLVGMIFFFDLPETKITTRHEPIKSDVLRSLTTQEEEFDSDNDERDLSKQSQYAKKIGHGDGTFEKLQTMSRKTVKHHDQLNYSESIASVRQLLFSNIAFPTTVAILFIAKMANEIILSSCGSITSRYFNWTGAR